MRNVSSLSSSCQAEIFLLAEYQSEDFHLDRALFLACKDDRLRICPKVKSGEGRVYKCLMMNKQVVLTFHSVNNSNIIASVVAAVEPRDVRRVRESADEETGPDCRRL